MGLLHHRQNIHPAANPHQPTSPHTTCKRTKRTGNLPPLRHEHSRRRTHIRNTHKTNPGKAQTEPMETPATYAVRHCSRSAAKQTHRKRHTAALHYPTRHQRTANHKHLQSMARRHPKAAPHHHTHTITKHDRLTSNIMHCYTGLNDFRASL